MEKKQQIVVSRFGVLTLDASYIMDKLMKSICALSNFGFIVDAVGGDGAAENRSALKQLATISARDVLTDTVTHFDKDLIDILPIDMKIGFYHPIHKEVIIFISADMPHLMKKIVNAFERSSVKKNKTALCFRNKEISLGIVKDL